MKKEGAVKESTFRSGCGVCVKVVVAAAKAGNRGDRGKGNNRQETNRYKQIQADTNQAYKPSIQTKYSSLRVNQWRSVLEA